jgi:hypothetical protein
MTWFSRVIQLLERLVVLASAILKVLRLRKPGMVFIRIYSEEGGVMKFKLVLPAPGAADVVSRKLTVAIGSDTPIEASLDGSALESLEMSAADGAIVAGSLVDVDDAGNASDPSTFSFVITDTIPPPAPGLVGLVITSDE